MLKNISKLYPIKKGKEYMSITLKSSVRTVKICGRTPGKSKH